MNSEDMKMKKLLPLFLTAAVAMTVGAAEATRIFLPIAKCDNYVAGTSGLSMQTIIEDAIQKVKSVINQNTCE